MGDNTVHVLTIAELLERCDGLTEEQLKREVRVSVPGYFDDAGAVGLIDVEKSGIQYVRLQVQPGPVVKKDLPQAGVTVSVSGAAAVSVPKEMPKSTQEHLVEENVNLKSQLKSQQQRCTELEMAHDGIKQTLETTYGELVKCQRILARIYEGKQEVLENARKGSRKWTKARTFDELLKVLEEALSECDPESETGE